VWAGEVTHDLEALSPLELLPNVDREEHDQRVRVVSETALAECGEGNICHLLDSIINLTLADVSLPLHRGVVGYLHSDLIGIQAVGLKGTAVVNGNQPIVAVSNKSAQEQSWKSRAVSARGTKTSIVTEGAVGVVIHVHLQKPP
jgi:hypothetical protein